MIYSKKPLALKGEGKNRQNPDFFIFPLIVKSEKDLLPKFQRIF